MTQISPDPDAAAILSRRSTANALSPRLVSALELRRRQTERIADSIDVLADACVDLADRITAGGRLFVLGSGDALPDARHLALEFLHPVIVGKRAVAAVAVGTDDRLGAPGDVLVAIPGSGASPAVARALADARARGLLTIAIAARAGHDDGAPPADHVLDPCATDASGAKEGRVVLYHLLWELTHVLLEESERLAPTDPDGGAEIGALYPFLGSDRKPPEALRADLCASGVAKLHALSRLREDTVRAHAASLASCAATLRRAFAAGGELLVFGNGGSQTDADWIATGLGAARQASRWRARSLASDPAVLSALANDVGFERVFARQVAAFGRPGDTALGISTSGSSGNVVDGLVEAKRKGLVTIGLAGGGGGRMVHESDLDFLFVVASDSVHRIQEVHATLYHLLEALAAEDAAGAGGSECDS